jgi:hypothetical protein
MPFSKAATPSRSAKKKSPIDLTVVGGFEWPPLLRDGTRNPQAATETLERELKLLLNENL